MKMHGEKYVKLIFWDVKYLSTFRKDRSILVFRANKSKKTLSTLLVYVFYTIFRLYTVSINGIALVFTLGAMYFLWCGNGILKNVYMSFMLSSDYYRTFYTKCSLLHIHLQHLVTTVLSYLLVRSLHWAKHSSSQNIHKFNTELCSCSHFRYLWIEVSGTE